MQGMRDPPRSFLSRYAKRTAWDVTENGTLWPRGPPCDFCCFPKSVCRGPAHTERRPRALRLRLCCHWTTVLVLPRGTGGIGHSPGNVCPFHPEDACSFPWGRKRGSWSNTGFAVSGPDSSQVGCGRPLGTRNLSPSGLRVMALWVCISSKAGDPQKGFVTGPCPGLCSHQGRLPQGHAHCTCSLPPSLPPCPPPSLSPSLCGVFIRACVHSTSVSGDTCSRPGPLPAIEVTPMDKRKRSSPPGARTGAPRGGGVFLQGGPGEPRRGGSV